MRYNNPVLVLAFLFTGYAAGAQKPFNEGVMVYRVTLQTAENTSFTGTYTFTYKGSQIRKDLKLNNGYEDVVLLDCGCNKAYSLQNSNGKKYAIELSMDDMHRKQEKFKGFTIKGEEYTNKKIAGLSVNKATIVYHDGSGTDVLFSKEYQAPFPLVFERFPDARFLPLSFSYKDDNGMVMQFEAEKVAAGPVENAVFRIPTDYKMITNAEYKQLSK
jgi:hypothetical protein